MQPCIVKILYHLERFVPSIKVSIIGFVFLWLPLRIEEGTVALEMPYEYIVEMICDWWSFSWKTGNLCEIFDWYDQHKNRMILADNTKKLVERFLEEIKMELDKDEHSTL